MRGRRASCRPRRPRTGRAGRVSVSVKSKPSWVRRSSSRSMAARCVGEDARAARRPRRGARARSLRSASAAARRPRLGSAARARRSSAARRRASVVWTLARDGVERRGELAEEAARALSRALASASLGERVEAGRRRRSPASGRRRATSSSCRRAAPGPKRDRRPKATTRTSASWRVRTAVTRVRSCALKPWARKRTRMRCTNGCCEVELRRRVVQARRRLEDDRLRRLLARHSQNARRGRAAGAGVSRVCCQSRQGRASVGQVGVDAPSRVGVRPCERRGAGQLQADVDGAAEQRRARTR